MLSNIETGGTIQYHQGVQGIRGKRIVIVGDCEVSRAVAAVLAGQGGQVFFAAANDEELGELLAAVANARGEGDGMVASLDCPEEMRRFFTRAKRQLGQVDVLVYQPAFGKTFPDGGNQLVESAMQHMRSHGSGHIISIHPSGGGTASLRHKAAMMGIRVTRIEPAAESYNWAGGMTDGSHAADVANCVFESIAQPFAVDVVYLQDQFSGQML